MMKQVSASVPPKVADTGRIRFGGGWRLPSTKPVR
jgi:hypothetical protein